MVIDVLSLSKAIGLPYFPPEKCFPRREMIGSLSQKKPVFLSFEFEKNEHGVVYTKITSDYDPTTIAKKITSAIGKIPLALKNALQNTELELPPVRSKPDKQVASQMLLSIAHRNIPKATAEKYPNTTIKETEFKLR